MGNCAGCTNPERRYRSGDKKQLGSRKKYETPPLNIANTVSKQNQYRNSLNGFNYHSQYKPNIKNSPSLAMSSDDPWKSRIAHSRIVRKYHRQPTLKQQQFKNQIKSSMVKPQQNTRIIRAESLQRSIFQRKLLSPKATKQKYGHQFQQNFCEQSQQIKQILNEGSSQQIGKYNSYKTPINHNHHRKDFQFERPIYQYDHAYEKQRSEQKKYLAKKSDKYRDKQLADIMQTFELQTHTPAYVKQLKQQQGQDICNENFGKFDQIPNFQWFSLGKYLEQITQDGSVEQQIIKKQQKTGTKSQKNSQKQLKRQISRKQITIKIQQVQKPILALKVK